MRTLALALTTTRVLFATISMPIPIPAIDVHCIFDIGNKSFDECLRLIDIHTLTPVPSPHPFDIFHAKNKSLG
jgi:hypothetical protein